MSDNEQFYRRARDESRGVWLDHLPLDICTSIASFLKPKQSDPWELRGSNNGIFHEFEPHPTSIPLAAVSKYQRRAVEAAQEHRLHFENMNSRDTENCVKRWRHILRSDVREVNLAVDLDCYSGFDALLAFPAVIKATIPCAPNLMTALINGGTVKKLQLHLMRSLANGLNVLPNLLQSCAVEELRLICHQCDNFVGAATGCTTLNLDSITGGSTIPSLTSLQLVCTSVRAETLIRTTSFFPNLRDLSLQRWGPPEEMYVSEGAGDSDAIQVTDELEQCLQDLESVGMMHYGKVDLLVPVLKQRLTRFSCHTKLSLDDMRRLDECPNLNFLDVVLAKDAEKGFPIGMCSLTSLSLRWESDPRKDVYDTPDADSLTRLLVQNSNIKELRIHSARLSQDTLREMLQSIARSVTILEIPIFKQGECPLDRFLYFVRMLVEYEIRLNELEADISSSVNATDLRDHDASSCIHPECVFCSFPRHVCYVAGLLRRRMPALKLDGLERLRLAFAAW